MTEVAAVFIIILHISVVGIGAGDALPPDLRFRRAYATEALCLKQVANVRAALQRNPPPIMPSTVRCERLEIVK